MLKRIKQFFCRREEKPVEPIEPVIPGQIREILTKEGNPFKKGRYLSKVLSVKDGWVNYAVVNEQYKISTLFSSESMEMDAYKRCYSVVIEED